MKVLRIDTYIHILNQSFGKLIILLSFVIYSMPSIAYGAPYSKTPEEALGVIMPPPGTEAYMATTGNANQLLPFVSTLLTIVAVIAGIWVLVNIFLAAYTAIMSSGDAQAMQKVRNNITNSVIGLLLIVLAYTIAALAGAIFFGDSNLFINPTFSVLDY